MTVLITLTIAGTDTGPFDLYSDVDGYVSAFETGVSKAALEAGYSSALVPNGTTVIRVKSTGICTNYVDITVTTTTTTTTSSTTTTTTTTAFVCADCKTWNYVSGNIPLGGDIIHYYSCYDGTPQTRVLSFGDPDGDFCNCNSVDAPYTENGTIITEVGVCTTTTTTTLFTNLVFDLTTGIGGYTIGGIDVNFVTPTLTGGTDVPFSTDTHSYNTSQTGPSEELNIFVSSFTLNGCITVTDSSSTSYQQNVSSSGTYTFSGLVIDNITPVLVVCADNVC
jgi:hypothetical protein